MKCLTSHTNFYKIARTAILMLVLSVSVNLFAAKGDSKTKKGVVLKFNGFDLKGINNLSLLSKAGFLYKGSFSTVQKTPQASYLNSIITYQKGNTTYIYPYQHKVTVPLFKTPAPAQR